MMARHRSFLEVRGVSRESSTTLTEQQWGTPLGGGACPLSTLSSHHSLLSSRPEYESTEGLHSSGISSADSWTQDDEFDRNATRRVRSMFEELQSALFENRSCITKNMEKEIAEWTEMFPHFRILGKQLYVSSETGTEFVSTSDLGTQHLDALLDETLTLRAEPPQCALTALVLEGTPIKPSPVPVFQEEFLASEGTSEEYLAYDKPEPFSSVAQVYYKYHQKPGFPPITPKSHRRHTIHSLVFEWFWTESMNACEPLIAKVCEGTLPDLLGRRTLSRPILPGPGSQTVHETVRGLADVMTIRRVPLQERSSSQQTELSSMGTRPHSSKLTTVKSVSGLGGLLPLRQKSRDHLLPPVDRVKILSPIFNVSAVSEGISSSGLRGRQLRQQPRRLPPLTADYENSEHFNPRVAGRHGESRAASAQPEEFRRNFRTFYTADGRPNTTSTFRVQTAVTRRPPSVSRKSMAPIGLEIFGASTGTTVPSKGSRLAVVDHEHRLAVVEADHSSFPEHSPSKTPTITENVFTKPGRVWITGVQGAALRKSSNVR